MVCSSCSIFNCEDDLNFKKIILLMDSTDVKDNILINFYSKGDFELRVPLRYLPNSMYFSDDKGLRDFCKYADSIISNNSSGKIVTSSDIFDFWLHISRFSIRERELFKSGDYLIYNKKTKTYVKKITVKSESRHYGPLSGYHNFIVIIDDFEFLGIYVTS